MSNLKNVKEYIRALEHMLTYFRSILDEEKRVTPAPASPDEKLAELTDLRMLSKSNIWPEAIDPTLLAGENEEDKLNRAEGIIIEYMGLDLKDKRLLAYRADEYIVRQAKERNAMVFTDYVVGDFDAVLFYDVLDHHADPVTILKMAAKQKKPEAKVFVRCHPWASRTGTHLYRKLNKAYLHLVFTNHELIGMGLKGQDVTKLLNPLKTYKEWFAEAGLKIEKESTINQDVDSFFTTRPAVVRRIKENWWGSTDPDLASGKKFPHEVMQIQFADFVLV